MKPSSSLLLKTPLRLPPLAGSEHPVIVRFLPGAESGTRNLWGQTQRALRTNRTSDELVFGLLGLCAVAGIAAAIRTIL